MMFVGDDVLFHFLEQIIGKDKFVESFVGGVIYLVHVTDPFAVSFIYECNVLADTEHRVHVVGVYDCGDVIFVCDITEKFVNHNRSAWVKT